MKKNIGVLLKKSFSVTLSAIILLTFNSRAAEEAAELASDSINDQKITENYSEMIVQDEYIYNPSETVENFPFVILNGDEDEAREVSASEPDNELMASGSSTELELWDEILSDQLSEDYLSPYRKKEGINISGNTNRLTISSTDLSLQGKNGMDLVFKRKYDSQQTKYSFYLERESSMATAYNYRYCYFFTDDDTGEEINVAFQTNDEYYIFMNGGAYLTGIDESRIRYFDPSGGGRIYYYLIEDIEQFLSDEPTDFHISRDTTKSPKYFSIKTKESTYYVLYDNKVFRDKVSLGDGWILELPEVTLSLYDFERTSFSGYTRFRRFYNGVFRDFEGDIQVFQGDSEVKNYSDNTSTYTSSYYTSDNRFYQYSSYYATQTIEGTNITYNFKIVDSGKGYTYYFNSNNIIKSDQDLYIRAIVNKFGDTIVYNYDDASNKNRLTSITDTYGRTVTLTYGPNTTQISYTNGENDTVNTLTYTVSAMDNELENGSILTGKPVSIFTFSNQYGEETKYYSREFEQVSYRNASSTNKILDSDFGSYDENNSQSFGNIIEKIEYPNGLESNYKYQRLFYVNALTDVTKDVYIVQECYDKIGSQEYNHNQFELSGSNIFTLKNTKSSGSICNNTYDNKGRLTSSITSLTGTASSSAPYIKYSYTYNNNTNNMTSCTENNSGMTKTTSYTYVSMYGDLISSVNDGNKKIAYTYHTVDGALTKMINSMVNSYKSGSSHITDYTLLTTLTENNKSIEYVRIIKNNEIKAQKKYVYDNGGNIIGQSEWIEDTDGDGVLDTDDEYSTVNSIYTVSDEKTLSINNSMSQITDADNLNPQTVSNTYTFDIYGNPTSSKDSKNYLTTVTYDELGRITGYSYPNGGTGNITYNTVNNYTIQTDVLGAQFKYTYNELGQLTKTERLNGDVWQILSQNSYDSSSRLVEKITYSSASAGSKEEYTYDALDRLLTRKVYELPSDLLYTENYTYSVTSNQLTAKMSTTASDNSVTADVLNKYDCWGRLIQESKEYDDKSITTSYTYDYCDRVLSVTDPEGGTTSYTYDWMGNVISSTDPMNHTVTNTYDLSGNIITATDAMQNITTYEYDKLGRLISVTSPFDTVESSNIKYYYDNVSNLTKTVTKKTVSQNQVEEYYYDCMGNVTSYVLNGMNNDRVTAYTYNAANQMTSERIGLTAYSENPTGGNVTTYEYNSFGQLISVADNLNKKTYYNNYDYLGNCLSITDRNENTLSYTYGLYGVTGISGSNVNILIAYNDIGQQISAESSGEDEAYTYDPFGRVATYTMSGSVLTYTYDDNSNVTGYEYDGYEGTDTEESYQYNANNQLTQMSANGITTTYTYNANGNLTEKSASNGITTTYGYNNAGLITSLVNANEDTTYSSYTCNYLVNGLKVSEIKNGVYEKVYQYDDFNQVIYENVINAQAEDILDNTYTYDNFGNRTSLQGLNESHSYTYDSSNRMLTDTTYVGNLPTQCLEYTYDNNGNMLTEHIVYYDESGEEEDTSGLSPIEILQRTKTYTYNGLNQMCSIWKNLDIYEYYYLASGLSYFNSTVCIWNGSNLAFTYDNGICSYDNTGITSTCIDNETIYYLKDMHGNVTDLIDEEGTVIKSYDYDAFGNHDAAENDMNPFRYCGEYYDRRTGFVYLRNRFYNTSAGRFISEDPVRDGINWYVYCGNDPVNCIDPLGLWEDGDEKLPQWAQISLRNVTADYYAAEAMSNEDGKKLSHERAEYIRAAAKNGLMPISGYERPFNGYDWNINPIKSANNCYSYMLNLPLDPDTGKLWEGLGMQPGQFGDEKLAKDRSNIVSVLTKDLNKLGYSFKEVGENEVVSKNAYKVALVLTENRSSYHWYVQHIDGTWSHKEGALDVRQTDASYKTIYNPKEANRGEYTYFVGFFEVKAYDY